MIIPIQKFVPVFISLLLTSGLYAQTVTNGSMNGTPGNSQFVTVAGWTACTIFQGWNNTPDVCDINFPSYNGQTTMTPVASPDGGTWAGLANGVNPIEDECIIGNITGLTPGGSYQLKFYGACFGVGIGNYSNGNLPELEITVDGNVLDTIAIPMTASTWFPYCIPFIATTSSTTFMVHNIIGGGYAGVDGFTVTTGTIGTADIGNDTTLCAGQTLLLDATSPGSSYQWQDNSTNPTFTVTQAGTYWVTITGACSVASDTIIVQYGPSIPGFALPNDTAICPTDQMLLDVTMPGVTYQWQDNSTNPTFTVTQPGTYWVEVTNSCGSLSDTVVISDAFPQFDLGNDTILCAGQTFTLIADIPGVTYQWQDNSTLNHILITAPGTYWVEVTNVCGSASDTMDVTFEIFDIGLQNDTLCDGDTIVLDASHPNAATYVWQNNATGPTLPVTMPGLYVVQVTSQAGCAITDSATIALKDCTPMLEMPNVFSPEGDGINDVFYPVVMENIASAVLDIYNRWGLKIFHSETIATGWDGTYNGQLCSDGTYFWTLHYVDINAKEYDQTGFLTLVK